MATQTTHREELQALLERVEKRSRRVRLGDGSDGSLVLECLAALLRALIAKDPS